MLLLATATPRRFRRLCEGLATYGFDSLVVQSAALVWQSVIRGRADAIAVDLSASSQDLDPWRLAADLREATGIRIIALTREGRNRDRARAFRMGIPQTLRLPVTAEELAACLRMDADPQPVKPERQVRERATGYDDGAVQIDVLNRQVLRDGNLYGISPGEQLVLQRLIGRPGRFVGFRELCTLVSQHYGGEETGQRLKMYVSLLRRKIEPDRKHPRYILTRRGLGYAFMPRTAGTEDRRAADGAEKEIENEVALSAAVLRPVLEVGSDGNG
jgi:DNA-binding response OmpR family regulator